MRINKIYFFVVLFLSVNMLKAQEVVTIEYNRIFFEAEQKISSLVDEVSSYSKYPRSINNDGTIREVAPADWTSGFFPGSLWYMYENTGADKYKTNAISWTNSIESMKNATNTHDLGFMLYCSFGNGLRLASPPNYSNILVTTANSLMTRVNPTVGCMKSWDWAKQWDYPVIIDNMMNLELLFWASKETGDSKYYDAAVEHANTTIANHFRSDNSSYHVIDYDVSDGSVKSKETHQGYNNESDWARGQAWGLYGYTMSYRETNEIAFLQQAEKIASFIMNHPNLPTDLIPYWDLKDPKIGTNPNSVPRDASAATVMASALIELSQLATDGSKYMVFASKILNTLSQPGYTTASNSTNNFILLQSTGNLPSPYNPEINTSINYADYYYLEALTRYKNAMVIDFEPYTVYISSKSIDANTEFIDEVIVYDIDNVGGFTVSLKNNPEFVSLKEIGKAKYEITANPSDSDAGNHNFEISINYNDGSKLYENIVYDVTTSLSNGDIDNPKVKVYINRENIVVEGIVGVKQITIYDISGTVVMKKKISSKDNTVLITIPYLNNGLYIYEIETTKGFVKGKIIKG